MKITRSFSVLRQSKLGLLGLSALLLVGCEETPDPFAGDTVPAADAFEVLIINDTDMDLHIWAESNDVRLRLGKVNAWTSASFDITQLVDQGPVQLSAAGGDGEALVLGPVVGRGDGRRDHSWKVSGRDLP